MRALNHLRHILCHSLTFVLQVQSFGDLKVSLVSSRDDPAYDMVVPVLRHWSCPDSELKLVPPLAFQSVEQIISTNGNISQVVIESIVTFADALHDFIIYGSQNTPGQGSPELIALLTKSLAVAKSSL